MAETVNILTSATGAGNSKVIQVVDRPMTFSLWGTPAPAEYALLKKRASDGTTFQQVYDKPIGGTSEAIQMDSTRTAVTIDGGGHYRWDMAARTAAQGIDMDDAPAGF